jgi:putative FmdB family regulatory protein
MPIYAYRCAACGHSRDVLQKLSDAPLTACPACGAEQFSKQVTAAGFQLKGSGWYVTDFRNNGGGGKSSGGAAAPAPVDSASAAPSPAPSTTSSGSGGSGDSGGSSGSSASSSSCGGGCACH